MPNVHRWRQNFGGSDGELEEKAIHGGVVCLIEVVPSKCGRVGQVCVVIKVKQNGDMVAGFYWRQGRHGGYEVRFASQDEIQE